MCQLAKGLAAVKEQHVWSDSGKIVEGPYGHLPRFCYDGKNERYQGHLWNDRFATLGSCLCKAQPPVATGFWAAKSLQRGGSDPRASNSADNSAPESMMCRDRLSNCWQVDLPIAEVTLWYPVPFVSSVELYHKYKGVMITNQAKLSSIQETQQQSCMIFYYAFL